MKMALVHDWLNQRGGAEDTLEVLMNMYPDRPLYTSLYWRDRMPEAWQDWDTHLLWTDKLPFIYQKHQAYLMVYPLAWHRLDLSDYDVVFSHKSGFCHGFQAGDNTLHICYCMAPTRYVWQFDSYMAHENVPAWLRKIIRPFAQGLKGWDYRAAQRVDHFLCNSTETQRRIRRYYDRDATVIYPPVDVAERFQPANDHDDYFLSVGRMVPYKRVDLVVEACTRLNLPLKVAGKGRDLERLQSLAGPTIEFLGFVPDEDLPELFARAKAFVFPGLEDFGITPVQAQAAGRPVIAYGQGGALDSVIPGKTGSYFTEQSVESLMRALQDFDDSAFDPDDCRQNALCFDTSVFRREINAYVNQAWEDFKARAK